MSVCTSVGQAGKSLRRLWSVTVEEKPGWEWCRPQGRKPSVRLTPVASLEEIMPPTVCDPLAGDSTTTFHFGMLRRSAGEPTPVYASSPLLVASPQPPLITPEELQDAPQPVRRLCRDNVSSSSANELLKEIGYVPAASDKGPVERIPVERCWVYIYHVGGYH